MNRKSLIITITTIVSVSTLIGCSQPSDLAQTTPQYRQITLGHDGLQVVPAITTLPAGENYKLTIMPESDGKGCMSSIKREGTTLQDAQLIVQGEPIEFVLNDPIPGEYKLVCNGMGMEQGKIIIEA